MSMRIIFLATWYSCFVNIRQIRIGRDKGHFSFSVSRTFLAEMTGWGLWARCVHFFYCLWKWKVQYKNWTDIIVLARFNDKKKE